MTWLSLLPLVAITIGVIAVLGIRPKGTRPVGSTHLMNVGRVILMLIALLLAWATWRQ
jgi:hypothetical protein